MDAFRAKVAATSLRFVPRKRLSRLMGRLADLEASPDVLERAIATFSRVYGVDMSEAEVPEGGFASFDAFFTRTLRPGARPVAADPDVLVSPADGRLDDVGAIDGDGSFVVKGHVYRTAELLGLPALAPAFAGGAFAVVYLAPPDYHRVHAPVAGQVSSVCHVDGTLLPVNEIGTRHFPNLFARNERVSVVQRLPGRGSVASILVGAIGVGRISLSFDALQTNSGSRGETREYGESGPNIQKGEELGMFHLGSTVVLLASADARVRWTANTGIRVRMGEGIAKLGAP